MYGHSQFGREMVQENFLNPEYSEEVFSPCTDFTEFFNEFQLMFIEFSLRAKHWDSMVENNKIKNKNSACFMRVWVQV